MKLRLGRRYRANKITNVLAAFRPGVKARRTKIRDAHWTGGTSITLVTLKAIRFRPMIVPIMRLSYAIKFEDFQTLQPPVPITKSTAAGFRGVLAACALIALLGVFSMFEGMGLPVGLFLIGLGLAAAAGAYFYEQRSVRKTKENYDKRLAADFQRIHCRDERIFTADEAGFTASCKCGTVTRPWSELTSFSESKTHFAFNTKMGGQILPKSAFPSEAEVTEFRTLASGKLHHDKPATAPHFDFALRREDYRAA